LITVRCSTLRGTFCSLITLATPRQDWRGSNPSRREGGVCGFTLSRSHSCCAVRLVYIQISPGHIWTILYIANKFQPYNCRPYGGRRFLLLLLHAVWLLMLDYLLYNKVKITKCRLHIIRCKSKSCAWLNFSFSHKNKTDWACFALSLKHI